MRIENWVSKNRNTRWNRGVQIHGGEMSHVQALGGWGGRRSGEKRADRESPPEEGNVKTSLKPGDAGAVEKAESRRGITVIDRRKGRIATTEHLDKKVTNEEIDKLVKAEM